MCYANDGSSVACYSSEFCRAEPPAPKLACGTPVELQLWVATTRGFERFGQVVDYETCDDGQVEVRWIATDSTSWLDASLLRSLEDDQIDEVA